MGSIWTILRFTPKITIEHTWGEKKSKPSMDYKILWHKFSPLVTHYVHKIWNRLYDGNVFKINTLSMFSNPGTIGEIAKNRTYR